MKSLLSISLFLLIAGCSQTASNNSAVQSPGAVKTPSVEITEISNGSANINITVQGSRDDLLSKRSCEIGRFATQKGATHVQLPETIQILNQLVDGNNFASVQHDFTYAASSETVPEGSIKTDRLLERCTT